jgi:hypothetical protein
MEEHSQCHDAMLSDTDEYDSPMIRERLAKMKALRARNGIRDKGWEYSRGFSDEQDNSYARSPEQTAAFLKTKKASPFSDGGEDEYGNHQKHEKDEYGNVFNEEQVDEVKSGEIANHPWVCRRARTPEGDGEVIRVCREHTFSQMVPFVTMVWVKLDSGKTVEVRQNQVKIAKKQGVEEMTTQQKTRASSLMSKQPKTASSSRPVKKATSAPPAQQLNADVNENASCGASTAGAVATAPSKKKKSPGGLKKGSLFASKVRTFDDMLNEGEQINEYKPKVIPKTMAGGKLNPNHPGNKDAIAAQKAAHLAQKEHARAERHRKAIAAQNRKHKEAMKAKAASKGQKARAALGSSAPTNPLEKKARDAMYDVWNAIAPDMMQAIHSGGYEDEEALLDDPFWVAEVCCDANHMQTFAHLSREEEEEVLSLGTKTLARLASDFGY